MWQLERMKHLFFVFFTFRTSNFKLTQQQWQHPKFFSTHTKRFLLFLHAQQLLPKWGSMSLQSRPRAFIASYETTGIIKKRRRACNFFFLEFKIFSNFLFHLIIFYCAIQAQHFHHSVLQHKLLEGIFHSRVVCKVEAIPILENLLKETNCKLSRYKAFSNQLLARSSESSLS